MPIEIFETEGGMVVKQSFVAPSVYLDHWAIRLFSEDRELQDQFVKALLSKRGTLLLSSFTFAEFARPDDRKHTLEAEAFIERLLPNIFLTDFAFDRLHERELSEPDNRRKFPPPSDLPQLKLFAERAPDSPLGFTMAGFISLARDNYSSLYPVVRETLANIRAGIESMRADPEYVKKARNVKPNEKRTRSYVVMGELTREFELNPSLPLSDNNLMDMLHATIPVNCCDFLLLDAAWEDRVSKLRQRITNAGLCMPIAQCYSRRNDGIKRFLIDLNAFSSAKT